MTNRQNLAKFKTNMTVKEKRQSKQKAKKGQLRNQRGEAKTIRSVKIATPTVVTRTKDVHILTTAIASTTTHTEAGMRIADIHALTIISMKAKRVTILITGVIRGVTAVATTDAEEVTTIEAADLPMKTPIRRQPQAKTETQKLQRVSNQETGHKEKDKREENRDLTTQTEIEANIGEGTVGQEVVVIADIMKGARAEMARRPSSETRGETNVVMVTDPSL